MRIYKLLIPDRLILVTAILVALGCSDEPRNAEIAPSEVADPKLKAAEQRLRAGFEYFSKQPGRTGILAEKNHYSLFSEELMIRDFFQDRKNGFFIDVGCAWPIKASNTYYLEKNLGWTGIGIDALDDFADGWKKERPASRFFAYLVSDQSDRDGTFYKSEGLGFSSTNRAHAGWKIFGFQKETEELQIPMITLDDLLDRQNIENVDLLAMDIEGHEFTALQGFDLDRFQPELLVIEGRSKQVKRYLRQHGYEQIRRYARLDRANRYSAAHLPPTELHAKPRAVIT